MNFRIGEKVAYPNHGVCRVEGIAEKPFNQIFAKYYSLRLLANDSLIYVPVENADTVGIRPILNTAQCRQVFNILADGFEDPNDDWKIRTKNLSLKLQTGDIFDTVDVLKKLTFIARQKRLSFREQRMLEKARFLVISELSIVCAKGECQIEAQVEKLLTRACEHHKSENIKYKTVASH